VLFSHNYDDQLSRTIQARHAEQINATASH